MLPVDRVKAILLSPRTEWPRIDAEPATPQDLVRNYLVWLALIPAVASLIGLSLVGFSAYGVTVRVPFLSGLWRAIVSVAMTVAGVAVLAWVANWLAPRFKGRQDYVSAFKLVTYASTAALVVGVLNLVPALSALTILGTLYSLYLMYLGLPVLMKCPQEKAVFYTVAMMVAGFLLGLVTLAFTALFGPGIPEAQRAEVKVQTPRGEVAVDTRKLDDFAKKMESAARKIDEATKSGDPAALGKATSEALGAAFGGDRKPLDIAALKALVPETVAGLARTDWETESGAAMGVPAAKARAVYRGSGDASVKIEILDLGGVSRMLGAAAWAATVGERETRDRVERVYREGERVVRERVAKGDGDAEYALILANGVMIEAEGRGVGLTALKQAVQGLDLKTLEAGK